MEVKQVDRLETLDEVGNRRFVIPAEVSGFFHRWRKAVHSVLIFVFLAIPWTTWNGKQTIWLNFPKREFIFFGLTLSAQDAPLIFMILISATLALAFTTSIFGRVWCGWACPQTVFIEGVYRQIEKFFEGDYLKRRALRNQPLSFNKFIRVAGKWIGYTLVSSLIAHSFSAFFVGRVPLLEMMNGDPNQNWDYFLLISIFTGILLFNFAWFREQFCVIACPYGRIQSVLMDKDSLTIMYDSERGEPRKGLSIPSKKQGDCISCMKCVNVCPVGIDIRNGSQMECIGCTACIDACNSIMRKVNKPENLIRYGRLSGKPFQWLNPRPILYFIGSAVALLGLAWALTHREIVDITVTRAHETPYQVVKTESGAIEVTNHFRLRSLNQSGDTVKINVRSLNSDAQIIAAKNEWTLTKNERTVVDIFVKFGLSHFKNKDSMDLVVETTLNDKVIEQKTLSLPLLKPEQEL